MSSAEVLGLGRIVRNGITTLTLSLVALLTVAQASYAADVTITDANLLQALTETFAANSWTLSSPPQDTELSRSEFTEFDASNRGIDNITGLEACTSLTILNLNNNGISDLTPLAGLTSLEELYLGQNQITSIAPLATLTGLLTLDIGIGFNPLASDEEFNPPAVDFNFITDITPLAGMTSLEYLGLGGNNSLTDIGTVSSLTSLSQLWLVSTPIADFSQLESRADTLSQLFMIDVGLEDSDLSSIALLTNLAFFGVGLNDGLTDLSSLSVLDLTAFISLGNQNLTSIDFLSSSTNPAILFIISTPITSLPDFSGAASVGQISLQDTAIVDLSGLANTTLEFLDISSAPLSDLNGLDTVTFQGGLNLQDTQVSDLQDLVDNLNIAGEINIDLFGNPLSQDAACIQIPAIEARLTGNGSINTDAFCGEPAVLTINIVGTGTTSQGTGSFDYQPGTNLFVRALPTDGSGFAFSEWQGDIGNNNANQDGLNLTMDQDRTITAVFVSPADFTMTVNQSGPDPGYIDPGFGTFSYLSGNTMSLGTNGQSGSSYFAGWTGDVNTTLSFTNVLMDANKTVTANYTGSGFELNFNINGQGGINGFGSGTYYYAAGTVIPLDVFAFQGSQFDRWEGDIGGADPNSDSIEITMDQDRTIDVYFQEGDRTLTIAVGGTGSGTTSPAPGNYAYFDVDTAFVSATADPGSIFDHWEGDIGSNSPTNPFLNLPMTQDRTVTAIFGPAFTLTIQSTGAGDTFPAPGTYSYAPGQFAAVTANPAQGGSFVEWQGDLGGADPNNPAISLTMDQDRTVTAVFASFDWTVTLIKVGTGNITPEAGTLTFFDGETLNLAAAPIVDSGFAFQGWSGDISTTDLETSLTVDSDKTITATFVANENFLLTLGASANGTTIPAPGAYAFSDGQQFQIAAQADFGATFDGWTGDIGGADPLTNPLLLTMDQARNVTANFSQIVTYDLTIAATGAGTTNPAAGATYSYVENQSVNVTATPVNGSGQLFRGWTGDIGSEDPNSPSITLVMDQDRSITATFAAPDWTLTVDKRGYGDIDPAVGVYSFFDGDTATLEATNIDGNGYVFAAWSGDIGSEDPTATSITVTMDQDRAITALFEPENTLVCQQVVPGLAPYLSNEGTGYIIYDTFTGIAAPIGGLHFWGIQAVDPDGPDPFQPCDRNPDNIQISFYADNVGTPGTEVYSETFTNLVGVDTGEMFFDYNVKEYTVTLTTSVVLDAGWISIRGVDNADCWFLWSSSDQGDNRTFQEVNDGESFNEKVGDSAFCLIEGPEPPPAGHAADQNGDEKISLSELLRVIQFYNTGSLSCASLENPTEDGFQPGNTGTQDCFPHSSDYQPQNWIISLSELLRLIQFYNIGAFNACPDADPPTEDGFCVGAA